MEGSRGGTFTWQSTMSLIFKSSAFASATVGIKYNTVITFHRKMSHTPALLISSFFFLEGMFALL